MRLSLSQNLAFSACSTYLKIKLENAFYMNNDREIDDPAEATLVSTFEAKSLKDMTHEEMELMARKNHYAQVLKWQGKLHWDDQPLPQDAKSKLNTIKSFA